MRIGFDAKRIFFNHSGLGNYGRNIFSALCNSCPDNDYFLFTPHENGNLFSIEHTRIITPQGFYAFFSSLWKYRHIGHDARKYNLDIYHGLSNELPRDIDISGAKRVVTIHDTIFMRYPQWYKWHDRMIYKQKTAFACKKADVIIAASQQTKEDLIRFFHIKEEKIQVIYQPCNAIFSSKPTEKQKQEVKEKLNLPDLFILMVGNIEKRKNIINVINAVQYQDVNIPLVIVGKESGYALELKKQIAQRNIKNVRFCHDVPSSDLPAVYALANMFIYPSFFEGFGIPIIEALSCEAPVITSNTSCFKETGGNAVLYVDPNSDEEIAQAIYVILNDSELRANLIQKGRKQIKKFSPDVIAEKIMDLYRRI
ncbi:MAG: glycosyltransferase family 4 protein [Bacteroidales bacterium]|jgi:glycosyltransferase involved in cell wall biosynthesis|nr:glycosyltransferase family 4 protein [Bacteroidales bacterium]